MLKPIYKYTKIFTLSLFVSYSQSCSNTQSYLEMHNPSADKPDVLEEELQNKKNTPEDDQLPITDPVDKLKDISDLEPPKEESKINDDKVDSVIEKGLNAVVVYDKNKSVQTIDIQSKKEPSDTEAEKLGFEVDIVHNTGEMQHMDVIEAGMRDSGNHEIEKFDFQASSDKLKKLEEESMADRQNLSERFLKDMDEKSELVNKLSESVMERITTNNDMSLDDMLEDFDKLMTKRNKVISDTVSVKIKTELDISDANVKKTKNAITEEEMKLESWKKKVDTVLEKRVKVFESAEIIFKKKLQASIEQEKKKIETKMFAVEKFKATKLHEMELVDKKHMDELNRLKASANAQLELIDKKYKEEQARKEAREKFELEKAKGIKQLEIKHANDKAKLQLQVDMNNAKALEENNRIKLEEEEKRAKIEIERDREKLKIDEQRKEVQIAESQFNQYMDAYKISLNRAHDTVREYRNAKITECPPKLEYINGKPKVTPGSVTFSCDGQIRICAIF